MVALIAVPLLVALATVLSRRFGHGVGGVLAGLPLTSGPLSVSLAVDHGRAFAATAAVGSLVGITAATLACGAYAAVAVRARWPAATAIAIAVFAGGVGLGVGWSTPLAVAAVAATTAAFAVGLALGRIAPPRPGRPPRLGVLPRVVAAVAVVAVVTTTASTLGAELAGAVTPLPVVIGVLAIFAHREHGAGAAVEVVRGSTRGTYGFVAFFLVVGLLVEHLPLEATYALSVGATVCVGVLATRASRV